ncbi:unnamed protein product [Protopolystoma xenopodis]|uniref:Uncharacterized protein n=1 Tax=Protopolystoma xenopodis TaxID=117903 RepID=A0A448WIG1_9PLAT|nr:unnamed protein product [Protopolystoma xenopodis]
MSQRETDVTTFTTASVFQAKSNLTRLASRRRAWPSDQVLYRLGKRRAKTEPSFEESEEERARVDRQACM